MSERETPETDAAAVMIRHTDPRGIIVGGESMVPKLVSEKLERERDEAREAQDWRSIESAPTDGTDILTFPHYHITHYNDDRDQIDSPGWVDHWEERIEKFVRMRTPPTHWMPLPKPPTGGPER